MPLRVSSLFYYRAWSRQTEDDWGALWFVKVLKGEPVNSSGWCTVAGQRHRISGDNADEVWTWFVDGLVDWAHRTIAADRRLLLVPIPSKTCVVGQPHALPSCLRVCRAAAARLRHDAAVGDLLRWKRPLERASQGGPRNAATFVDELVCPNPTLARVRALRRHVVLVDDVMTSGSHMRAAAAKLQQLGANVHSGFVAARTSNDDHDDIYQTTTERLEDL